MVNPSLGALVDRRIGRAHLPRREQLLMRETVFPPARQRSVPHLCFNGASKFAVPGAVANVRNSFPAGGPADPCRIFVLMGRAQLARRAQLATNRYFYMGVTSIVKPIVKPIVNSRRDHGPAIQRKVGMGAAARSKQ